MIHPWVSHNYFRDHRQGVDFEVHQTQVSVKPVYRRPCPFFGVLEAVSVVEESQGTKSIC